MSRLLDDEALRAHKLQNSLQSAVLLAGLGAIAAVSALLLMGPPGIGWAAIMIGLMLVLVPRIPPEMVMRAYRGTPVDPRAGGQLNLIVDELTRRAELPARPLLYVIPSMTLNAFAVGQPAHAAIGISEGLLRRLTMREIVGVLGHEISHIRNNDLSVMAFADVMTRLTQAMSYGGVVLAVMNVVGMTQGEQYASWTAVALLYLAPTLSSLLQLAVSRNREYDADLEGAELTGDPLGLASALSRLEHYTGRFWEDLMLPVPGRKVPFPSVLRTHPETADRVRRLRELAARHLQPAIVAVEEPMISLAGLGPVEMRPRYRFPGYWY